MRADAEIQERLFVLDGVHRDVRLPGRLLVDQLHLERFAAPGEEVDGVLTRPALALVDEVLRGQVLHLRLDRIEVFLHERPFDNKVVVEPVIDGRTDAALDLGEQLRDGGREQVRRRVAIELKRLGVLVGHNPDGGIRGERIREVDHLVADKRGERGVGETRRDGLGDRPDGRAGFDLFRRPVGECDCDLSHGNLWSACALCASARQPSPVT